MHARGTVHTVKHLQWDRRYEPTQQANKKPQIGYQLWRTCRTEWRLLNASPGCTLSRLQEPTPSLEEVKGHIKASEDDRTAHKDYVQNRFKNMEEDDRVRGPR